MTEVVVLGGYGELGLACVQELAETTRAGIAIAGRSIQKAEEAALAFGDNVRAAYGNASDQRTLGPLVRGALAVIGCSGARSSEAIFAALEARVPFVGLAPMTLHAGARAELCERAWKAQVPIVLCAGAVPGIPGVLAEHLVRRVPEIARLRIVTTGGWRDTERAEEDVARFRREHPPGWREGREAPRRWRFPDPVGTWPVRVAPAADLDGFGERHCVGQVTYLEAELRPVARRVLRMLGRDAVPAGFVGVAEAWRPDGSDAPERVEISAPCPVRVAAAAAGILVRAILDQRIPAGLAMQHEAVNPGLFLEELGKRGARVRFSSER
jgi:hypothetical protein